MVNSTLQGKSPRDKLLRGKALLSIIQGEQVRYAARQMRFNQMTTSNDGLRQTPAGLPVNLRPFFQEYVLEDLDPERSAFTVIERTLARAEIPELRWLFAHYGTERLADWVRQAGWYCLPRRRFKYWLCFFELSNYRHTERIWPH
jgi:hypothetical protein